MSLVPARDAEASSGRGFGVLRMTGTRWIMWRSLAVVVLAAGPVMGQGAKPDRPPEPPPPPPPEVNAAAFAQAYELARRPTILTLVGFSSGEREAGNVEDTLFRLDAEGFTFQLRAAFNEFINAPSIDAELVSPTQLNDALTRVKDQLRDRNEQQAVQLIATQARAEQTVLIRLFGNRETGLPARGQMQVTNARGRELLSFPFEWKLGTDTVSVRTVARLLAIEYTNDFIVRQNAAKRWTVRLLDLNDPAVVLELRDRLEATKGIQTVRSRAGAAGKLDAYREFEVTTTLDALELEAVLAAGLKDRGLKAETVSTEGGVVNVRVTSLPKAAEQSGGG